MNEEKAKRSAPLTRQELRDIIGDRPLESLSATRLLEEVGHGSMSTVHGFLKEFKEAAAAALMPPSAMAAPTPPPALAELAGALWVAAYSAAQAGVLQRSETLASERDAARILAADNARELDEFASELDARAAKAEAAEALLATERDSHAAELAEIGVQLAKVCRARDVITSELDATRAELAREKELAAARAEGQTNLIESLNSQLLQARAWLTKQAEGTGKTAKASTPSSTREKAATEGGETSPDR